jgi:DinB superfamily
MRQSRAEAERNRSLMRIAIALVMVVWQLSAGVSLAVPPTPRERQRLIAHLEMTASWLFDEVSHLSSAQLTFRRAPEAWTILEVIDHLVVVGPIYWQDLQTALKGPGGQTTPASDADILWYGIDRTNREKAIPTEVPKGLRDLQGGLDTHRKLHARLLQYVRTTEDDLRGHIVERQGCDAYQWALLISTHEQRHILQIREIKADPKFPKQ